MKPYDSLRKTLFAKHPRSNQSRRRGGTRPSRRRSFEPLEDRRLLTLMNVTTFADVLDDTDGQLSLREAVIAANFSTGSDIIELPAGTYTLSHPAADADDLDPLTGDLNLTDPAGLLTIRSIGGVATIDAQYHSRVFQVHEGAEVEMTGLTPTHGTASGDGGAILNAGILTISGGSVSGHAEPGDGGAIWSSGTLTITDSAVNGSTEPGDGGAIWSSGTLMITNTNVSGHVDSGDGGGIYNSGTANIIGSEISDCSMEGSLTKGLGIFNSGTMSVTDTTINNNDVDIGSARGGGIFNSGTLTVAESTFSDNEAQDDWGGGIYNTGSVTITGSTFRGNNGGEGAGGIYNGVDGELAITDTTFEENTESWEGGGAILNRGSTTVTGGTFHLNSSHGPGGAIWSSGTLTISASTVSGNESTGSHEASGGGINNGSDGLLKITSSTVTGNTANEGGGIYNSGSLEIRNAIVALNEASAAGNDIRSSGAPGEVTSLGYNLIGDGSGFDFSPEPGPGDQLGESGSLIDPLLSPLQDNGGPTLTHALLPGSPAIDTGDPALAGTTDQRGIERPERAGVDIGAFELENQPPLADADGPYTIYEGGALALDATGSSDPDGDPLTFRWDVDGDGDFDEDVTGPTPTLTWEQLVALGIDHGHASWTLIVEVSDGEDTGTATTTLTVENTAPTLALDSVDMIDENGAAALAGTFTDPGVGDTHDLVVDWGDPNNPADSTFALPTTISLTAGDTFGSSTDGAVLSIDTVDKVSGEVRFALSHTYQDDGAAPGNGTASDSSTIGVTVSDEAATDGASTAVLVNNLPPEILSLSSDATLVDRAEEGETVTISATFSDVGTLDVHSVTVDWGDGTITPGEITESGGSGTVTAGHPYVAGGIYTITVTLSDDDTATRMADTTAVITGVGLNDGVLFVVGTAAGDQVSVNQQDARLVKVHADFLTEDFRTFDIGDVDSIIAYLFEGDDHMTIAGNVRIPAILHGGDDNDHLYGGGGPAVLLGDAGDDTLAGGPLSRNVLIGGPGADRLLGGSNEDLLIGGSTSFDADDDALMDLLDEWNDAADYTVRVAQLRTGTGATGIQLAAGVTVFDDTDTDVLTGAADRDWFFFDTLDDVTGLKDNEETN